MKKSTLSKLLLFSTIFIGLMACEKDDVSTKHTLTEEEQRIKDSIEAAKNAINADYIIGYEITLPLDTTAYRNVEIAVEDSLIAHLGYSSAEELTAAFGTVDGGLQIDEEITVFAVNKSTGFDYTSGYTANGIGYWFDGSGDVTTWGAEGEAAKLYTEFDSESFTFYVGQYPNRLTTGDHHKLIFMMKKGDERLAIVFFVTVGDYYVEETPEADIVATNELSLEVVPDNSYAATDLAFDFAAAASAMGISSADLSDDFTVFGINADGSMTSNYTADAGYWYTKSGNVTTWGSEGVAVYVNYAEGIFSIGQYPEAAVEGDEYVVKIGLMHNASLKMVVYEITVKIIGYVDPEEPLEGDPYSVDKSYEAAQVYAADWSSSTTIDVKDVMRDAFKMTTYQIHKAIEDGTLVFKGLNADGSVYTGEGETPVSTATPPGHWYALTGDVTVWGSETAVPAVYSELGHTNESLEFHIGHHPDNAKAGDEVTITQIAELNGGKVTFTFSVKIQ